MRSERAAWLYWIPAVATAALLFFLSHMPSLPGPPYLIWDKAQHAVAYGFFTLTLVFALTRGMAAPLRTRGRVLAAVAIASFYGVTDEFHQSFVEGRDPSVLDWVADTVGATLMAIVLLVAYRWMAGPSTRV